MGVEALSGWVEPQHGIGAAYRAASGVEEGLEMVACSIAIVAVLRMVRLSNNDNDTGGRRTAVVPLECWPS